MRKLKKKLEHDALNTEEQHADHGDEGIHSPLCFF